MNDAGGRHNVDRARLELIFLLSGIGCRPQEGLKKFREVGSWLLRWWRWGGDFNWIYRAEYCREVVQRHFVLYFRLIDSKLGVLIVVWGEKSRIWTLNLIHWHWSSSSSHLYLIKWSKMKLIVILFGWGNSSKILWSASILAFSLELLNWLKVSKNCK